MTDKPKPGPKPDLLKIDETDWEKAVGKAIRRKKPDDGWPKPRKREGEKEPSHHPEDTA